MSHRTPAVATGVAAALLAAVAGVAPASAATPSPRAKLTTSDQAALLASHRAVVSVKGARDSTASVRLYANGHAVSDARRLTFHRARTVRVTLSLTSDGMKRMRGCTTRKLEVRMAVHRGKQTTTFRDAHDLELATRSCPATPAASPASKPADTPAAAEPSKPAADAPQSDKALFRVGTSVVDISPDKPMVVGGYGANYTVNGGVRDPLQVRAFFVGKGKDAVTFVSADAQGWFAGYQSPNIGDGAADARREAAAILADRGYDVNAANVVVSVTHDHAAPTIQGIWGHTDPEYLHRVKQAAVQAVAQAESNARDAELWSAQGTIRGLVSEVQGTDQMAGFDVDKDLPILWAREPGTGKTLATYANVPTHVDQYNPINASDHAFSADYPGYVRDRLAETLGGTSVIAAGTLGRQESIGGSSEYAEVAEQGRFITNAMLRALAHAHRITDTTLGAATQSFSSPAENAGLLSAMSCNHAGGPLGACPGGNEPAGNNGAGTWFWSPGSIFTVNRSLAAPWYTAGGAMGNIGTSATVARIGDQVYATAPGEAFPEVTSAIERSFAGSAGIRGAHIIDHAGDQLGYYWDQRAGVYPAAQLAQSDFAKFNVSSHLAQDNVDAVRAAGAVLGLFPTAQNAWAEVNDPDAFSVPHVQFYPNRVESGDTAVSLYASAKKAQSSSLGSTTIGSTAGAQNDNNVSWDFGDGTTGVQPVSTRFTHTFPGPGSYRVQASVVDNLGRTYRWVQTVQIDAPLTAVVDGDAKDGKRVLTVRAAGGQKDVLSAHWTFSDGATADGMSVTHTPGGQVTVTIVDGAGSTATTTVDVG